MANLKFERRSVVAWFKSLPLENASIMVPAVITIGFEVFLLTRDMFWLRSMLGEIFTAYFGIVGIIAAALAQFEMVRIQRNVGHLVSMSLRPLEGFSEIFERALLMLKHTDDEFYFASFVGRFGVLHEGRAEVVQALRRLGMITSEQDMTSRVDEFENLLIGRVTSFRRLKLVLLEARKIEKLVERVDPDCDVEANVGKETEFRRRLFASLQARKEESTDDCVTVVGLPQQVLVARMRRPNGDRVVGCLVFLVGTETDIAEEPIGYYTEAPSIASVYVRYIEAIAKSGSPLTG